MDFERVHPEQLRKQRPARSGAFAIFWSLLEWTRFLLVELAWFVAKILGTPFVFLINALLDWWAPHYQIHVQIMGRSSIGGNLATDDVTPPGHKVEVTLYAAQYGPHKMETLDTILFEDRGVAASNPAVLYVHGGGWIAANSACLIHSVAPIGRAGFDVYSMDYPLAPAVRFPDPIVSVFRALNWIKLHEKHDDVLLLGDSAGGNLVTMAASLVCNHSLLESFALELNLPELLDMEFPHLIAVSSVYGIMDQDHWRKRLDSIGWLENKVTEFFVSFAFRMYRCPNNRFRNRITLLDIFEEVEALPPLQLVCGGKDILVNSNRRAREEILKRGGFELDYHEHETARHCYFGFPPAWLRDTTSRDALSAILEFFKAQTAAYKPQRPKRVPRPLASIPVVKNPHPKRWYHEPHPDYAQAWLERHKTHHQKQD